MTHDKKTIPVTAIILTFNEQVNIARCIGALQAFEDIVVVDSGSTDDTLSILETSFPHVRVFHNHFEDFGQQRNWAIEASSPRDDWIMFIDADEFMEDPLADEIARFIAEPGENVGGYIAGRYYFHNKWLKRCTFYPSYQLRLLRKGKVHFRREGHGQREIISGDAAYFKNSWYHDTFSHGIEQWIDRHNRYSTAEAELIMRLQAEPLVWSDFFQSPIARRRMLKRLASRLPCRASLRFLYAYVLRLGFLDGKAGFWFCVLLFTHECHISAKLAEGRAAKNRGRNRPVVS